MKVSIGIPLYNQGEYVSDAIESALSQEVQCEVVVCNDGSTDNSLDIAKRYEKNGVKIINQVNKGLSSARNSLIMNSSGDYFLPLDADDILLDNCISRILAVAGETGADVIAPSFKCFGKFQDQIILMPEPKLEDFKQANRIGYCSAIKREALLEVGGYSPRMWTGYEDLHLWINLLTRGEKIITIPEILWLYRTKDHSMIHDSIKHHEELMAQIFKDFPEFGGQVLSNPLPK